MKKNHSPEDLPRIPFNRLRILKEAPQIDQYRQDPIARISFETALRKLQSQTDLFPLSDAPKISVFDRHSDDALQVYENMLEPYVHRTEKIDKHDFPEKGTFFGHKIHLNVEPEDVKEVSQYLKENHYRHKYLSGGDISKGKVFTVYFGSRNLALQLAPLLSRDLNPILRYPLDEEEVEYAPNVVGRFQGDPKCFHIYGCSIRGVSASAAWVRSHLREKSFEPYRDELFKVSFELAANRYGVYFYGTSS